MTHLRVDVDFDAFARFTSDGIAHLSPEGMVSAWSSSAATITGISRAEALGRSLDEIFDRVDPPLGFALVPEDLTIWLKDENRRAIHAAVLTIDEGWLLSFGREARYAAIEQLKSEIVTAVSHELKTPIATIRAFANTLRQNPEGAGKNLDEYLATIEEQADRLSHAVDDLLMVGRVGAEFLLQSREMIEIEALLHEIERRLGPTEANRIECRHPHIEIQGDPVLLTDALGHLLENALKFSPHSSPVVVEAARNENATVVRVIDKGIGIAEEHLPYIFERFYRVERNLTAATGGSGLGLFVAHAIARAHGGTLGVATSLHEGSTFTLTIPVRG
jgi:two-component system, OmpR family, phosphate regulon sensor histidine kinase PhoR